ncbi:MAG: TPM domain-containing protein [Bacteroidetes bacterium]|nr:TPM domain-containing protein [Bacteroidota bacterium]
MSKKIIEQYFSDADLKEISKGISEVESNTSGEIRLCVHIKKGFFDKNKSPREIAVQQFLKLGMHKTKNRTGVLLYILLDEKKFEILADEGINKLIETNAWNEITTGISNEFKAGNYLQGVLHCVNHIGAKLKQHFPRQSDDTDELSNDVVIK